MKRFYFILLSVILLAACKAETPAPPPPVAKDDVHLAMQTELESAGINLSDVIIVRLAHDGKRIEVTSVLPAVISSANLNGQFAKTIFSISKAGNSLVLFSRDIYNYSSFRTEISLTELEKNKQFIFPIVQDDGRLVEKEYQLESINKLK